MHATAQGRCLITKPTRAIRLCCFGMGLGEQRSPEPEEATAASIGRFPGLDPSVSMNPSAAGRLRGSGKGWAACESATATRGGRHSEACENGVRRWRGRVRLSGLRALGYWQPARYVYSPGSGCGSRPGHKICICKLMRYISFPKKVVFTILG